MLYETEIEIVRRLMDEVELPDWQLAASDFQIQSYARWAGAEYLGRLYKASERLPPHLSDRDAPSWQEILDDLISDLEVCQIAKYQLAFDVALDMLRFIEYELQDCFADFTVPIMEKQVAQ